MRAIPSPRNERRSCRRPALLASVAGIAVTMLLAGPGASSKVGGTFLATPAQAAEPTGPASFADVVQKVKPAVISVRVKLKSEGSSASSSDGSGNDRNELPFPKGSLPVCPPVKVGSA